MRKIIWMMSVSLDGFMEGPNRELDWGLVDGFRQLYKDAQFFTWWDYRAGDFHSGRGMRIDLMLLTEPLAKQVTWGIVDRNARKGKQGVPSDHAPLILDVGV